MTTGLNQRVESGADAIAQAFVTSRASGAPLTGYPGDEPRDLAEAYRIQDAAIRQTARPVVGWKVGRINPPHEGVNRLAGPIFADQLVEATGGAAPAMPVINGGFAAAEAEFLLRIAAAPDPAKRAYTMADAIAAVDAVHVGIEIAGSPFAGINDHGPLVTISDFGNNNGLVVGPAVEGWRDAGIVDWPVTLAVNGVEAGAATAATMLDGPFGAVRFLLEHMAARGAMLAAGQWVSTGAVTGIHRVSPGDRVEARFNGELAAYCTITAR